MIGEIKRRIEANEDVTVKAGVVTGTPCVSSYGYGKSRPSSPTAEAAASKPVQ